MRSRAGHHEHKELPLNGRKVIIVLGLSCGLLVRGLVLFGTTHRVINGLAVRNKLQEVYK